MKNEENRYNYVDKSKFIHCRWYEKGLKNRYSKI
jgi:hypothetical protein